MTDWYPFIIGLLLSTSVILALELRRERFQKTGGKPMSAAEVWLPDMDPSNPAVGNPDIVPIETKRQGDTAPSWQEDTVTKGIAELRQAYTAGGMHATDAELRDEVMLMLNAEGGEIE